jgi:hypothetical protein
VKERWSDAVLWDPNYRFDARCVAPLMRLRYEQLEGDTARDSRIIII